MLPWHSGAAGVSCVIAKSFARIFYRNAINVGLAIMECPEAVDAIADGARVAVDTETGTITNLEYGRRIHRRAVPVVHRRDHRSRRLG